MKDKKYHSDKAKEWREKHPIRHKRLMKKSYEKNIDKKHCTMVTIILENTQVEGGNIK